MKGLRYTLLADGTSDRMLIHVINWAVRRRPFPRRSTPERVA